MIGRSRSCPRTFNQANSSSSPRTPSFPCNLRATKETVSKTEKDVAPTMYVYPQCVSYLQKQDGRPHVVPGEDDCRRMGLSINGPRLTVDGRTSNMVVAQLDVLGSWAQSIQAAVLAGSSEHFRHRLGASAIGRRHHVLKPLSHGKPALPLHALGSVGSVAPISISSLGQLIQPAGALDVRPRKYLSDVLRSLVLVIAHIHAPVGSEI